MESKKGNSFLDDFFNQGIITEIVGSNYSFKYHFISLYLIKKIIYTKGKILYLDTELSCPISFIYNSFQKLFGKDNKTQNELENSFMILRLEDSKQLSLFIEHKLINLIKSTENIQTIVLSNVNSLFLPEKIKGKKSGKYYLRIFLKIAKENNINIIYLNDIYFRNNAYVKSYINQNPESKENSNYVMEIEYSEFINDFCSNIIFINDNYSYNDRYLECKCQVLKSSQNTKEFSIQIDLEKYSFKLIKEN